MDRGTPIRHALPIFQILSLLNFSFSILCSDVSNINIVLLFLPFLLIAPYKGYQRYWKRKTLAGWLHADPSGIRKTDEWINTKELGN